MGEKCPDKRERGSVVAKDLLSCLFAASYIAFREINEREVRRFGRPFSRLHP